ncbi:conserved hypothetical protein [Rippkaea orientalis PCC 8801]|uniref:DUF3110 domain-containing protein n=1 Tax=Rippkaea orientalis (strain PCC 8801 / RF-1) TaxID=41431 RepID=B7JYZ0_RIPO1|nr:DUF3110 domain-containing protein [Rippkaea orientalis]ACK66067.1 conserved hypothetical protein [Rippkaea orientalis PCC 8801]
MAKVYVLLFNARTENEGIHTLQIGNRNKVLMFESEDDATRYALLLEAQDFPTPTPEPFDSAEIEAFCREADYDCEIIKEGMLAIPPEQNVEQTDWEKGENPPEQPQTEESPDISNDELDRIRRQLEGLL